MPTKQKKESTARREKGQTSKGSQSNLQNSNGIPEQVDGAHNLICLTEHLVAVMRDDEAGQHCHIDKWPFESELINPQRCVLKFHQGPQTKLSLQHDQVWLEAPARLH